MKWIPMISFFVINSVFLNGCINVQPWEKGTLAQDTMKSTGPVPALGKISEHVYYSKESVRGGMGVGGAGCGCN